MQDIAEVSAQCRAVGYKSECIKRLRSIVNKRGTFIGATSSQGGGNTGRNIWDTSRYVLGNGIPIGIGIPCIGFRWEWDKNLASHGNRNRVDGNGNDPYSHGNVILTGNCKMQLTNKGRNRIGPLVHTEC